MAKEGKSSKQGRNKNSPSMIAYKAQDRRSKNKRRRRASTPPGVNQSFYDLNRTRAEERAKFTALEFYGIRF